MANKKLKKWGDAVMISIDDLDPNSWNPQVMTDGKFTELVEEIHENGFDEPLQVVAIDDGRFRIIGGEHRFKAARELDMKEIPCVVKDWDEQRQKLETVRRNLVHGDLDSRKFTSLVNNVAGEHDQDLKEIADGMGFASDMETFDELFKNDLPEANAKEDEKKVHEDISKRVTDDLIAAVNQILNESGDTVENGFVHFVFRQRPHLMVSMNMDLKKQVEDMAVYAKKNDVDINEFLSKSIFDRLRAEKSKKT
ncbi:ParB N-terminal domain-containing protein [Patescibacteria group bacterium]|nr:ParB N-terminal domain-containing protein [Patescibacteria group bacterium]